jgi:hypothetical protein
VGFVPVFCVVYRVCGVALFMCFDFKDLHQGELSIISTGVEPTKRSTIDVTETPGINL